MKPLIYFVSFFLLAGCCGHNKYFKTLNDFVFYQNGKSLIDPDPNQMRVFSYENPRMMISHSTSHDQDTTHLSILLPTESQGKVKYLVTNYKLNRTDTLYLEYTYYEDCKFYDRKIQKALLNNEQGIRHGRFWVFNLK